MDMFVKATLQIGLLYQIQHAVTATSFPLQLTKSPILSLYMTILISQSLNSIHQVESKL